MSFIIFLWFIDVLERDEAEQYETEGSSVRATREEEVGRPIRTISAGEGGDQVTELGPMGALGISDCGIRRECPGMNRRVAQLGTAQGAPHNT
jgi:hypothetical protein